jgi:hypothetical protein
MPAFGVSDTFGLTAPSGYIQESSQEEACDVATIKGATGNIEEAMAKPLTTTTVNIRTKGQPDLVSVHTGQISGTIVVTSSKVSESNDDFATAEITGIKYS